MKKTIRTLLFGIASLALAVIGAACAKEETPSGSVSSDGSSSDSSYPFLEEVDADTLAPQITARPTDKQGIEAGTLYDFSADRGEVVASDNQSSGVEVRVVDIAKKDGRSVYSAAFIDKFQFTQAGEYTVTLSVSDLSENKTYATYGIEVVDTKAPIFVGESAYNVTFDENYHVTLPTVEIEEYSSYTVAYKMTDVLGRDWAVEENGLVRNPMATTYEVEYTAVDAFGHSQSFKTSVTVSNAAPEITIENTMGAVWTSERVSLPMPQTQRLSDVSTEVYMVSGNTETRVTTPTAYTFTQSGEYTFRYKVVGAWYAGGEFYKTGKEEIPLEQDIVVEVEDLGVIDFEKHNGKTLPASKAIGTGQDSAKVAYSENFGDGYSLRVEMLAIGFGSGISFGKSIPLPKDYDAIRLLVQCGGSERKMEIKGGFIFSYNESGGQRNSNFEVLSTEQATEGTYYILALDDTSFTHIDGIYIANSYGAGGGYKDEFGIMRQPGENRDFYIDNVSFVMKPTLSVDSAELEEAFLFAGDSIELPTEVISHGEGYPSSEVSVGYTLNGTFYALNGYTLENLVEGTYAFVYSANVGGALVSDSFTITVSPKVPSIVYKNKIGLLREGQALTLPVAKAYWMEEGTTVLTEYKHENGAWTAGDSIASLEEGTYSVRYTAEYGGNTYTEEFTFQVLSGVLDRHTFEVVNGEIDGDGISKGDTGNTVAFENGVLKLGGWWGGIIFDEPLSLDGANVLVIRVKGEKSIGDPAFHYYDQNGIGHTTELVVSYPAITTEYQEFSIVFDPTKTTAITGFWILGRQTVTYVEEVYLIAQPIITYQNTLGVVTEGDNVTLPTAQTMHMDGASVTTEYKLSTATEWTTGTSIENITVGEYLVRYTATYEGVTYTEEFTFTVLPPLITDIIGGTSVEIWATQGTVTQTEDGLAFEYTKEWWTKARFDPIALPQGTTKIVVTLKASEPIESLLFQVLDGNGAITYTAGMSSQKELGTEFVSVELDIGSLNMTSISGLEICTCGQVVTVQSVTFA